MTMEQTRFRAMEAFTQLASDIVTMFDHVKETNKVLHTTELWEFRMSGVKGLHWNILGTCSGNILEIAHFPALPHIYAS